MTTSADVLAAIPNAIEKATGQNPGPVPADTDLLGSGTLDSLDWSVFLLNLEKQFSVKIDDEDAEINALNIAGNLAEWIAKSAS